MNAELKRVNCTFTCCCSSDSDSSVEGHAQHIRESFTERVRRAAADVAAQEAVKVGQTRWAEKSRHRPC